jgi:hypothetical protein
MQADRTAHRPPGHRDGAWRATRFAGLLAAVGTLHWAVVQVAAVEGADPARGTGQQARSEPAPTAGRPLLWILPHRAQRAAAVTTPPPGSGTRPNANANAGTGTGTGTGKDAQSAVRAARVAAPPDATAASALAASTAGDGEAGEPAGLPPPVYATRVPAPRRLHYQVRRGDAQGTGELDWRVDADGYGLSLRASLAGRPPLDWHSGGGLDAAGVAPLRLVERKRGKDALAVNFQRDKQLITFSASTREVPSLPGAQDRLSWLAQLAAIARARDTARPWQTGDTIELMVASPRGEVDRWRFTVLDATAGAARDAGPATLHLLREPERPYDTRAEVWLAADVDYLPAALRLSTLPGSETLSFESAPQQAVDDHASAQD